jgi:hypothetical protein
MRGHGDFGEPAAAGPDPAADDGGLESPYAILDADWWD